VQVDSDAEQRIKELEEENAKLKEQNDQAKAKNEVIFETTYFKKMPLIIFFWVKKWPNVRISKNILSFFVLSNRQSV